MDMHYVYDDGIKIENITVVNEFGNPLIFELIRKYNGYYVYDLVIEVGNSNEIIFEYDIHYVSICHNGDPSCYHAYICDSYAVFENMNHILFVGGSGYYPNDKITALRFILPPGWVRITPWKQFGDYFVENIDDIIYSAPGVGRLELHREKIRDVDVIIGIHERANEFALYPDWPINIQNVMKGVKAADSVSPFESNHAITIGIPPLGTNEGAINTMYTPADNFPWSFASFGGMDDLRWYEGRWLHYGIGEYFGPTILYKSGAWEWETYKNSIVEKKNIYINEVYNSAYDLPIPDLENSSGPEYNIARNAKFTLVTYFLDYEIRKVTGQTKSLTDAILCWRHNLPIFIGGITITNEDMLQALNTCIGKDFTDIFNSYFYGTERFPIELDWYYNIGSNPKQVKTMPWIPLLLLDN